ncbi:arylamine N-acetyltransferase family protein [Devosia sp.]|uniref:arylamine N-acetyltransferase family protein n=1 Tax=Devosia sp. TaxID=1871048 RepID=UPI003A92D1AF
MAEEANIDAYFERIGFAGSIAPNLETLSQLHQQHPAVIPFENLDALMGAPVRLELSNLQQKMLFDKRGGFCLEHNLLFKAVLESLDFDVRLHGARVLWGHDPSEERPISHIVLTVDIAGTPWLADVGFGGFTPTAPLRLRAEREQATPHETFRLMGGEPDWLLEVLLGEDWKPIYSFEEIDLDPERLNEINEAVSKKGSLHDNLVATRAPKGRRLALRNNRLSIYPAEGELERTTIADVAGIREALTSQFGIQLPSAERLDPALLNVLEGTPPAPAD